MKNTLDRRGANDCLSKLSYFDRRSWMLMLGQIPEFRPINIYI